MSEVGGGATPGDWSIGGASLAGCGGGATPMTEAGGYRVSVSELAVGLVKLLAGGVHRVPAVPTGGGSMSSMGPLLEIGGLGNQGSGSVQGQHFELGGFDLLSGTTSELEFLEAPPDGSMTLFEPQEQPPPESKKRRYRGGGSVKRTHGTGGAPRPQRCPELTQGVVDHRMSAHTVQFADDETVYPLSHYTTAGYDEGREQMDAAWELLKREGGDYPDVVVKIKAKDKDGSNHVQDWILGHLCNVTGMTPEASIKLIDKRVQVVIDHCHEKYGKEVVPVQIGKSDHMLKRHLSDGGHRNRPSDGLKQAFDIAVSTQAALSLPVNLGSSLTICLCLQIGKPEWCFTTLLGVRDGMDQIEEAWIKHKKLPHETAKGQGALILLSSRIGDRGEYAYRLPREEPRQPARGLFLRRVECRGLARKAPDPGDSLRGEFRE